MIRDVVPVAYFPGSRFWRLQKHELRKHVGCCCQVDASLVPNILQKQLYIQPIRYYSGPATTQNNTQNTLYSCLIAVQQEEE
eukprot:scaffold83296_cov22-Tisochrysis_lutea.AAC.1